MARSFKPAAATSRYTSSRFQAKIRQQGQIQLWMFCLGLQYTRVEQPLSYRLLDKWVYAEVGEVKRS